MVHRLYNGERYIPLVALSVYNTGVGLAEASLDLLFDAFYTTKPEGMGLGLAISRRIIEAHGGQLWATPNVGPGRSCTAPCPCPAHRQPDQRPRTPPAVTISRHLSSPVVTVCWGSPGRHPPHSPWPAAPRVWRPTVAGGPRTGAQGWHATCTLSG